MGKVKFNAKKRLSDGSVTRGRGATDHRTSDKKA